VRGHGDDAHVSAAGTLALANRRSRLEPDIPAFARPSG
jgi:hypothetical protein